VRAGDPIRGFAALTEQCSVPDTFGGIASASATQTSEGQVAIAKPVREHLELQTGAVVSFELNAAGEIVLRPVVRRPKSRFGKLRRRATVKMQAEDILLLARGGSAVGGPR
jgi:bifunctional DNA-binding transcriptional regulator/antitoxin component of YhaV-PrlF toxin-antitoxin module